MFPTTPACEESKGKTLIGKDCESQNVIARINSVDKLFCDIIKRQKEAASILGEYCFLDTNIPASSSSSSSYCPVGCIPMPIPEVQYMITVNDLDQDVYDLLALLESEACAALKKLRDFELINTNCNPTASSSSSSSLPTPSSSSSSSSAIPSSSSSSDPGLPCSSVIISGGQGVQVTEVNLGTATGYVTLNFDAYDVPDRFVVVWDNETVIDTGYRGDPAYDADLGNLGLPPVVGQGNGSATFNKYLSTPTKARLIVRAPLGSTYWEATLGCPDPTPPSSSSSSAPSCPLSVWVAAYCDALPELTTELFPRPMSGVDFGLCEYQGVAYIPPPSSSSSSSSGIASSSSSSITPPPSSSSSSSSGIGEVFLKFKTNTNVWELSMAPYGVVAQMIGFEYEPRGTYSFIYGPCAGESVFII